VAWNAENVVKPLCTGQYDYKTCCVTWKPYLWGLDEDKNNEHLTRTQKKDPEHCHRRMFTQCRPAKACILRVQRACIHDKRWPGWEVVVGIEVHAQIKSRRKLFSGMSTSPPSLLCSCSTGLLKGSLTSLPSDPPNTHVSAFDAAFPGSLPVCNHRLWSQ
jgi:GatB/GatE catalytic domain